MTNCFTWFACVLMPNKMIQVLLRKLNGQIFFLQNAELLSQPIVLHHGEVDRQDLGEGAAQDEAVRLDLARPENGFHLGQGVDEGADVAGDVDADRAIQVLETHLDKFLGLFENT